MRLLALLNYKWVTKFLVAIISIIICILNIVFNRDVIHLVKFENYEFQMKISKGEKIRNLYRKGNLFQIDDTEYDLPVEQNSAHTFLFGIYNAEILANLLGIIYFDQEKGWTLLNRGTIIGTNRFSIEFFLEG